MLSIAIHVAFLMIIGAMLLNLWRLARGPDLPDRILALDTLSINAIALVMLLGISLGSSVYLDAALLIAMTGFVGTAALCKFILSGDIIE
jgi:multicomponent K+:H+ antiporter subunit F